MVKDHSDSERGNPLLYCNVFMKKVYYYIEIGIHLKIINFISSLEKMVCLVTNSIRLGPLLSQLSASIQVHA